jgi:hypothetical protein
MAYGVPDDRWRWRGLWVLLLGLFATGWIIFGTGYQKVLQDKNEHQWTKCTTTGYQFVLTENGGDSRGTVTSGECAWNNVVIASCGKGCGYTHCVEWNQQVYNTSAWDCIIKPTDCSVVFRFDMPNPYWSVDFVWAMLLIVGCGFCLICLSLALCFWEEICCFADHSATRSNVECE